VNANEVKAGMVFLQCENCPYLSASDVSFSRWGAIQISLLLPLLSVTSRWHCVDRVASASLLFYCLRCAIRRSIQVQMIAVTGGTIPAQWEDVTGTTPLSFVNDTVVLTTSVSARCELLSVFLLFFKIIFIILDYF